MPTIERIETIALRVPLKHLYKGSYYKMRNRCTIITRIHASDGIVGQSYNADTDEEQHEVLSIIHEEIAPLVVGLDVTQPERVWHSMVPVTLDQLRDRAIPMQAIACVDSAVWDAMGKVAGLPLWKLWGGYRDRIPVIAIGGYYGSSEEDLERELEFFSGTHGLVGMKFKIGARAPHEDAARACCSRVIACLRTSSSSSMRTRATRSPRRWRSSTTFGTRSIFAGSRSRPAGTRTGVACETSVCAATSTSPLDRARSAVWACAR